MATLAVVVIMSALATVTALTPITNANIYGAVALWNSDQSSCIATYGHISFWDTGSVTSMDYVFCGTGSRKKCPLSNTDFNEDLSKWDVSKVTSTLYVSIYWSRCATPYAHRST